jgi:aldose 1-epimerase
MDQRAFGRTRDGQAVELYTLRTRGEFAAEIATYGGIVTSLRVPDRQGRLADVVLGFDSLDGYLADTRFMGAIIGRYANRIAHGRFDLDGRTYVLAANDGPHHLHGGARGFHTVVWRAEPLGAAGGSALRLGYTGADGEEGYPGRLEASVVYALTDDGELRIEYCATTDRPTVVNLTHHSYFNLAGRGRGDVLGHELTVHAGRFTPVDAGLIPTGELRGVEGTPFDFRKATRIGARLSSGDPQLALGRGYDHNFVLEGSAGGLRPVALLREPGSGRVMEVLTTEPGLHLYTGNSLEPPHGGLCLETQRFPDSPHRPEFPSARLDPGQRYASTTVYRFSAAG